MERSFPVNCGAVHPARLDPVKGVEVDKCRPVVLLTAQYLLDVDPPVVLICPLSRRSDPAFAAIHLAIPARDQLQRESYAMIEHCREISRRRIFSDRIARVSGDWMGAILSRLARMIGRFPKKSPVEMWGSCESAYARNHHARQKYLLSSGSCLDLGVGVRISKCYNPRDSDKEALGAGSRPCLHIRGASGIRIGNDHARGSTTSVKWLPSIAVCLDNGTELSAVVHVVRLGGVKRD